MTEKEKIVYILTNGAENPEKASLPFVLANAAMVMEVEAVVALQGPAIFFNQKGVSGTCACGWICSIEGTGGVFS